MSVNIREDQMQHAELFGKPVLYTNWLIPRDTVPEGWYCYDLRGTDESPGKPATLEDHVSVYHAGTVLSPAPLKKPDTKARRINGTFVLLGELLNLEDFCEEHGLEYPKDTRKFILRPASPDEAGLFFSTLDEAEDRERACVGHMRLDFGSGGREFWHTWWDHNGGELKKPEFETEFQHVVDELRERGPLKDLYVMASYCNQHPDGKLADSSYEGYGFITDSEEFRYCLRCSPRQGDYNGYLYVYDKRRQELNMARQKQFGLTDTGKQKLLDAANLGKPHSYSWFISENFGTKDENLSGGLTFENAMKQFTESGCDSKVLGVTKDEIATIDLVAYGDGELRHLLHYQESDSFKQDPVVLEAVQKLHQALDAPELEPGMKMGGM